MSLRPGLREEVGLFAIQGLPSLRLAQDPRSLGERRIDRIVQLITGIEDHANLEQAFEAVRTFKPMDKAAVAEAGAFEALCNEGKYELFKTSSTFEGTAKNNDWLGTEVPGLKRPAPAGMID